MPHCIDIDLELIDLRNRMLTLGASEMGNLTRAEAALFHSATDLIDRLVDVRESAQRPVAD